MEEEEEEEGVVVIRGSLGGEGGRRIFKDYIRL